jgi:maleylacetoacetate isomerase
MKAKLYGYWRSSASWRVRWAFSLKKIPYDYIPVNILKGENRLPEHTARSPLGALPVLEIAPDIFLSQSMAILMWIEENFASAPYLFGKDRSHRYKIIELSEIINSDTAPLQTPRAQNSHSSVAEEKMKFAKAFIQQGLVAFEKSLINISGKYCINDEISAADLFLIPQLYNAKRFGFELEKDFPLLNRIYNTCLATEECLTSAPEKQIDAVKT